MSKVYGRRQRLLCSIFCGALVLLASLWLNFEPLLGRSDDIALQWNGSVGFDSYPLGWPRWFFHDFSDVREDVASLLVDLAIGFTSILGATSCGWFYFHLLPSIRWSLKCQWVVVAICAIWIALWTVGSPSAEVLSVGDVAVAIVLIGLGGAWLSLANFLEWAMNWRE
jgi:hypothetical protein